MWYNEDWWMSNSPSSSNNASCTNEIMIKVLTGTIGVVPDGFLTLQNESVITFSGLVSILLLLHINESILIDFTNVS